MSDTNVIPISSVFSNLVGGSDLPADSYGDPMMEYQARVSSMIQDARSFNDEWLAPAREEADRYYKGIEPHLSAEGRSTFVSTEVKDVIMGMMPSLIRIFTSAEPPVGFEPTNSANADMAKQATDYASYVFMEDNDGYRILHDTFMDALKKATGVVTWYTDNTVSYEVKSFSGASRQQIQMFLQSTPNAELIQLDPQPDGSFSLSVRIATQKPLIKVEACPPDEFRIDRAAKSVKDSVLVGRERMSTMSELVAMGYSRDMVEEFRESGIVTDRFAFERVERNPGLNMDGANLDPEDAYVSYGEYFILIDRDGDGIAELHEICTMGQNDEIVQDTLVDYRRIALFCPDFEPHTAIGHSIGEYCYDLQRIKSNMMRNSLDSLANTIFPRNIVNETNTNMDDVLNSELGAPIRTRGDPSNSVKQLETQFHGEQVLPYITYIDAIRQQRTGVSEASKGLDPKALQSTTLPAVNLVINGAQERIELVARNLAYTGMRDLMSGMLREITDHPNAKRMVELRGKFVQVDPSQYDVSMKAKVNPHIGKGSDADRMMILGQIKQTQEMVMQTMGPDNPMVTPIEYRNTLEDLLALGNIKEVSRYFRPLDQQVMASFMDQKKQAAASNPNPALILAQTEQEKVRAQTVKAISDDRYRNKKLEADNDFRYMQLQANVEEALLTALGQYGIQPEHDMAKHLISTAKDLLIEKNRSADSDGESEPSGDVEEQPAAA